MLAEWLNGEHLEDVKDFDRADFKQYADIYTKIAKGERDPFRIIKETHRTTQDLIGILGNSNPAMYKYAVNDLLEERKTRLIKTATAENIDEVIQEINRINSKSDSSKKAENWGDDLILEIDNRAENKPMKYGLPLLDKWTGGIRKGELTTIAARPGVGKSAFCLQVAVSLYNQGKHVMYLSLEMTAPQIAERLICRMTDINHDNIKSGNLTDAELEELFTFNDEKLKKIEKGIDLLPNCRTIKEIETAIVEYEPEVLMVDQLSLLKGAPSPSIREQFTYYTKELKTMAMKYNIAVLLAAQLRRGDSTPTLNDLKESGSIEEDSDNVLILHRPNTDDFADHIETNMLIRKQRNGRQGQVEMTYNGSKFYFSERY